MTFKLDESPADLEAALRALEADERKLSPTAKSLLILAVATLEDQRKLLEDISSELSAASKIRVGMMDSQSRSDEVAKFIQNLMLSLDARIREHLSKPRSLPKDAAVI